MKDKRPEVLVSVIRRKKDKDILLSQKWYRIPLKNAPRRRPKRIAFYQTAAMGKKGKKIEIYGKVKFWRIKKRIEILPNEKNHPRANLLYIQFIFSEIKKLIKPVKNKERLRMVFGFTSLEKLLNSRDLKNLFDIPLIEEILARRLKKEKIKFKRQYFVKTKKGGKFFMDFAVITKNIRLNIECDGFKWHSQKANKEKDKKRDKVLRGLGWKVLRASEENIINNMDSVIKKINTRLKSP